MSLGKKCGIDNFLPCVQMKFQRKETWKKREHSLIDLNRFRNMIMSF